MDTRGPRSWERRHLATAAVIMATKAPRNPPFRAEHMGSLLRPADLLKERTAYEAGSIKYDQLEPVESQAIKTTVKMQTDLGFRAISDGEYRYVVFWHGSFPQQLTLASR